MRIFLFWLRRDSRPDGDWVCEYEGACASAAPGKRYRFDSICAVSCEQYLDLYERRQRAADTQHINSSKKSSESRKPPTHTQIFEAYVQFGLA